MTRRVFLQRSASATALVAFLPVLSIAKRRSPHEPAYFEHTILAMGTTARLALYAHSEAEANAAFNESFAELKRLEGMFSVYDPASEVSKLNGLAGKSAVPVSEEMLEIVARAVRFSELTNGAFDITVEPFMRLWGFRNDTNELTRLPTTEEIERTLPHVGSHLIEIDHNARTIALSDTEAKLDLGGIAVGFALDRVAAILRKRGITSAFLDISGDVIAIGAPLTANANGWKVAIPDPTDLDKLIYERSLTNTALATSGNYMSYVIYQAQKFGHIIDPKLGRSATQVLSVTAIANEGITVDALSTGAFVAGRLKVAGVQFVTVETTGKVAVA